MNDNLLIFFYLSTIAVSVPSEATIPITSTQLAAPSTGNFTTSRLTTSPTTSTVTSTTSSQTTSATMESAIRISAQKCREYADYAYKKTYTVNIINDVKGWGVGGEDALRSEFPHMALIGFRYNNKINWGCGGTLISEQFVLSAEHCSYSDDYGPALRVRLGEHDLSRSDDATHIDFDIIEIIHHENVPQRTYNDIVLFKLDRKVKFNHAIRPACLPQQIAVPRNVSATGWGCTSPGGSGSDVLQKVDLTSFSITKYRLARVGRRYSREYDEGSIVFAGHLTRRRDTCQGDSGGPLQVLHETLHHTYVVVGVTSVGKCCARIGIPAIYTGVYSHLDWIVNTVWPNE